MNNLMWFNHNSACEYADAQMFPKESSPPIYPKTTQHQMWLKHYDNYFKMLKTQAKTLH